MSASQLPERAAKVLMSVYRDICPESEVTFDPSKEWHYRLSPAGVSYVIGSTARAVVQKASSIVVAGSDYPLGLADDRLLTIVLAVKDSGVPLNEVCQGLADGVDLTMQAMTNLGEWECVMVVSGFDLQCGPMEIGRCRFLQLDQSALDEIHRRFHEHDAERAKSIWNGMAPSLFENLIGQQVAIVRIQAVDAAHATAIAQLVIQESLNVWCYGQAAIDKFTGCCLFPEMKWPSAPVSTSKRLLRLDTPDFPATETSGPSAGLPLLGVRDAPGWDKMLTVLKRSSEQRSEINNRLLVAAQWCANAAFANTDSVRMVSLATGLEALSMLSNERGTKRGKIKKRLSWILGATEQEREDVSQDVENVYVCRNECLHDGRHHVQRELFEKAIILLSRTVKALTCDPRFSAMTTMREVVDWINLQRKSSG